MSRQKYKCHTVKLFARAFSFLELQVALVILAIGLWGFAGLFRVYSRQTDYVEQSILPVSTYYIVSQTNRWMKQFSAPAEIEQIVGQAPWTPPVTAGEIGDYHVQTTSGIDKNFTLKRASINVRNNP